MLIDLLAHHATWTPDKVALISREGEHFSYRRTYAAIAGMASALHRQFPELVQKAPLAICLSDRRRHFLLTIALEYLGIPSLPFVLPLDPGVAEALNTCATLLADQQVAQFTGRQIMLDEAWLSNAEATPADARLTRAQWHAHEVMILIVTSGSTGAAKCIRLSYQARLLREANRAWRYGFSPATRYLVGLPISVSNVFLSARAVLRCAGTVVFLNDQDLGRAFHGITHTTLLPMHVRIVLDVLPEDYRHPHPMRLLTVGAALSGELRERARRVLNAEVESNYGCNESGGIGQIDSSGIGHLFPGTDMKVVDAHQHELAHGSPGVIWVRSQEIADGYTDAANSQAHFIDGWFVTGDHGVMLDARTFRLLGRVDTLINLGGHKVAPDAFEACLVALGLARDLAVTSIPGAQGIEQFCVCLEGLRVSEPELRAGIRSVFGAHTGHIAVVLVEKIHRNAAGKIQRQQMQQLAVSLASGHANK